MPPQAVAVGLEKNDSGNPGGPDINESGRGKPEKDAEPKNDSGRGPVQAVIAVNKSLQLGNASNASVQARIRVVERLRERIQLKAEEAANESSSNRDKTKQFMNQNVVRERVMALQQLRNLTNESGIGEQVSEVARNFENSLNKTLRAEERINSRSGVRRLFFGGDSEAADEIEAEVAQNRLRITQLNRLRNETEGEINDFLGEQIREMEAEQNRLNALASSEKKSRGLLGWLFK